MSNCFTNDSSNNDSGNTSNNIVGENFEAFLNNNNTRIIFNKKSVRILDIFNNQI